MFSNFSILGWKSFRLTSQLNLVPLKPSSPCGRRSGIRKDQPDHPEVDQGQPEVDRSRIRIHWQNSWICWGSLEEKMSLWWLRKTLVRGFNPFVLLFLIRLCFGLNPLLCGLKYNQKPFKRLKKLKNVRAFHFIQPLTVKCIFVKCIS